MFCDLLSMRDERIQPFHVGSAMTLTLLVRCRHCHREALYTGERYGDLIAQITNDWIRYDRVKGTAECRSHEMDDLKQSGPESSCDGRSAL